jgi:hypothetical protein
MNMTRKLQCLLTLALLVAITFPTSASAQAPPRFYWKTLVGGNAIPMINMDISGNANPMDPALLVVPESSFDVNLWLGGYARIFSLFDRSAMAAVLLPVGRVSGSANLFGREFTQSASGFGDPTLEFGINLIGPPPIKNIPDALRYEPGFSLDLLLDVIVPVGEYDSNEALNLGQNRWYGRIGAPIIWQIGDWVPGRRTTLEFLPAVWLYGDNNDFLGHNLSTDPKFQIEGHLTRDFHKNLWGSADMTWISGGKSSIDGDPGESLEMLGLGFTLGYNITENIQFTAGYMASISDSKPTDLRMDSFKLSLVFGWHPLIEGMKRLGGE